MVYVFSFALYGENPLYTYGLLENIGLIGHHFPTWKVYVYHSPDVPESVLNVLRPCSSVVLRPTGVNGSPNKTYRFFAIDEPDVEVMFVRDADSRVHWKDRWAIREFLKSNMDAHVIRDNPMHTAPITGGLWGIRKSTRVHIQNLYDAYSKKDIEDRWCSDQNFLADMLYPKIYKNLLVHFGAGQHRYRENIYVFPFPWSEETYCGRIQTGTFIDYGEPPKIRTTLNFLTTK